MAFRRISEPHAAQAQPAFDDLALKSLLDGLEVGVAYFSAAGEILYCNRCFADLLNFSDPDYLRSHNLRGLVAVGGWGALRTAMRDARSGPVEGELRIDGDRGVRYLRLHMGPAEQPVFGGAAIRASAIETTSLVNTNAALQEREKSLKAVTARILDVQDQERRRIARDLHDVTAQEIAVISMALGKALNHCQAVQPETGKEISDALSLLRKVQEEIRTLSYLLHPPLLDECGLPSALRWYVDGFCKRSGIQVRLNVPEQAPRLPIEKEIALFRVVQEGLTNVVRHSKSSSAEISFSIDNGQIELSVRDEGAGMSPRKLEEVESRGPGSDLGVGIPGMRERLRQFGGTLELQTEESGTRLVARLPLKGEESSAVSEASAELTDLKKLGQFVPASTLARKRILIADDHDVTRQGIRALVDGEANWEICGEARDGIEAVAKTKELRPDLVVLDLSMPALGGLSAAQQIRAAGITSKLLVFTTHDYPGLDRVIRAAGCNGYVQKARAGEDLVLGIQALFEGETFSPPLCSRQTAT